VPSFAFLKDDGATACGNWLYSGSYPGKQIADNQMARRNKTEAVNHIGLFPEWSWCWPVNRRILYNRASVDGNGRPLNPDKWVIKWDENKKWLGDVPDGGWAPADKLPFIMKPAGYAEIFSPSLNDGPFPEHYEPFESPVANCVSTTRNNPAVNPLAFTLETTPDGNTGSFDRFPVVATTYRMSEHWQSGAITRNTPWLTELVPDSFAEISRELARELSVKTGDMVMVESARGAVKLKALVTGRFTPFRLQDKTVHQIGLLWHFGFKGLATGATANKLTPDIGDPNTMIPEYKAFLCRVTKI
jgi:formate dehydrogenase major subunit